MTGTQPRHAQPCALASLHWLTATRTGIFALLAALSIGAAATDVRTTRPAVADVPPVGAVATSQPLGAPAADSPLVELSKRGTSAGPTSPTVASPPTKPHDTAQASALVSDGIPTTALQAYRNAAKRERTVDPGCGLTWPLLAGIGRAESDHGRFAGAILHTDGVSTPHIIGIPLDGNGTARILDTDHGRLDGDKVYDRAVGSMQFIPSTWAGYGIDGNRDGAVDPFNIFDAAAAAAHYLCVAGGDLTTSIGQTRAVRAYNNSDAYIALVLQLEGIYARGVPGLTVPIVPAYSAAPSRRPTVPPANPGPPLAVPPSTHTKTTASSAQVAVQPPSQVLSTTGSATTSAPPSSTSCVSPTATGSASASVSVTPTATGTAPVPTPTGSCPSVSASSSSSPTAAADSTASGTPTVTPVPSATPSI